jgi:hypothetical protein
MADIAKLDAVLKYIEDKPEEWNQGSWGHRNACGTAGCIAFHVGRHDGAEMAWVDWTESNEVYFALDFIGGQEPWDYARTSLGLTGEQAGALFSGGNTMADMRAMRDVLAAKPDATRAALCMAAYGAEDA